MVKLFVISTSPYQALAQEAEADSSKVESLRNRVIELRHALASDDRDTRQAAAHGLRKLGASAQDAVPDLIRMLSIPNDPDWDVARDALIAIGPAARIQCLKAMQLGNEHARSRLIWVLSESYSPDDPVRAQILCDGLKDPSDMVKGRAAWFIGYRKSPKSAIPILIDILGDAKQASATRGSAAYALSAFKDDAAETIPILGSIVRNREIGDKLRASALGALGSLGEANRDVVTTLQRILADESDEIVVRSVAAQSIGASFHGQAAMPELIAVLRKTTRASAHDKDPLMPVFQRSIVEAIAHHKPGKEAIPVLTDLFQRSETEHTRPILLRAFARIGRDARSSIPMLAEPLSEPRMADDVFNEYPELLKSILGAKEAVQYLGAFVMVHDDRQTTERVTKLVRRIFEQ